MLAVFLFIAVSVSARPEISKKTQAIVPSIKEDTSREKELASLAWPPRLANGKEVATDMSPAFLIKPANVQLEEGVEIARTPAAIRTTIFTASILKPVE